MIKPKQNRNTKYPTITSSKIFDGKTNDISLENFGQWRFHPQGLFSSVIFGPVLDYTCDCGKIQPENHVCEICGVESKPSIIRNTVIAQIKLTEPIPHPLLPYLMYHTHFFILPQNFIFYDEQQVFTYSQNIPEKMPMHQSLLYIAMYAYYKNLDFVELVEKYYPRLKGYFEYHTPEQYLQVAKKSLDESTKPEYLTNIFDVANITDIVVDNLKVLPAGLRQMQIKQFDEQKLLNTNKINIYYYTILKYNEAIANLNATNYQTIYLLQKLMQTVLQYFQEMIIQLTKKKGLIRKYKLGRRVNFSTRAVLVGDPFLKYDEMKVSYLSGLQLCYLPIVKKLIYEHNYTYEDAHMLIEQCLETKTVPDFLKQVMNSILPQYVLFLRQPVLHLPSTMSAKIVEFIDDLVIVTNQILWSGLNADQDGDTFGLFWLEENNNFENFKIENHIFTPRGELNYAIEYDSLLGWYLFAKDKQKE